MPSILRVSFLTLAVISAVAYEKKGQDSASAVPAAVAAPSTNSQQAPVSDAASAETPVVDVAGTVTDQALDQLETDLYVLRSTELNESMDEAALSAFEKVVQRSEATVLKFPKDEEGAPVQAEKIKSVIAEARAALEAERRMRSDPASERKQASKHATMDS